MKSVKYYAFIFQHRYSLKEYLEKNHGLTFYKSGSRYGCVEDTNLSLGQGIEYENTWVRSGNTSTNQFGVNEGYGNVLTWEAVAHSTSMVEAVPQVLEGIKGMTPIDSLYMLRLRKLLRLSTRRMQLVRQQEVVEYIQGRNIDIDKVDLPYSVCTPVPYEVLSHFLQNLKLSSDELRLALDHLFIAKRPPNARYMPHSAAVMVPITHEDVFLGFHGRHIDREGPYRYFNTGFLHELKDEVLFKETEPSVVDAISRTRQVILTKGMFDLFAIYQTGTHQVVSTLSQGVSYKQYSKVMQMSVIEIVVGHSSSRERETILGYQANSLKKIDVLLPARNQEVDETVKNTGDLSKLISTALKNLKANEDSQRKAMLRKRDTELEMLTEYGATVVVLKDEILKLVKATKRSRVKLRNAVKAWIDYPPVEKTRQEYVRIPKTFLSVEFIDEFGMELRTLLFLLAKAHSKSRTINYTHDALCKQLDITKAVLIQHVSTLISVGYLLKRKDVRRKGQNRTVVFYYYPSTINYGEA